MDMLQRADAEDRFDFGDLEPLFWESVRPNHASAWHGHVSFAHWIVRALQPRSIVELGTHNGVSFSAFCNAVKRSKLETRCFAVDTWAGDEHAGYYSDNVYADLSPFIAEHFKNFAVLLRCKFDDALHQFPAKSVDLLHIDGLHTFEAVKHDFETWLPKMSDRGVILFHDTNVKIEGFGVHELWTNLSQNYRNFDFKHSSGLGVLLAGQAVPASVASLSVSRSDAEIVKIRKDFEQASAFAQQHGMNAAVAMGQQKTRDIAAGRKNIALGKHAFQSSYHQEADNTPGGAVNGVKTGRYGFHTDREKQPWWMVDLGQIQHIGEVVIYNRLDEPCKPRSRNLVLQVSSNGGDWVDQYTHDGSIFGGLDGFPLRIRCYQTYARFIRVYLNGSDFLHLDEVEVYSEPPPA